MEVVLVWACTVAWAEALVVEVVAYIEASLVEVASLLVEVVACIVASWVVVVCTEASVVQVCTGASIVLVGGPELAWVYMTVYLMLEPCMQVLLEDCKFVLEAPGIEALVGAVAHSLALVRVAYKQVWLAPWVVDTLAFVAVEAHTPAQELEVVGRYVLVDVQHK